MIAKRSPMQSNFSIQIFSEECSAHLHYRKKSSHSDGTRCGAKNCHQFRIQIWVMERVWGHEILSSPRPIALNISFLICKTWTIISCLIYNAGNLPEIWKINRKHFLKLEELCPPNVVVAMVICHCFCTFL